MVTKVDIEALKCVDNTRHIGFRLGRVNACRTEDGSALEVDVADIVGRQMPNVFGVATYQPAKPFPEAQHVPALVGQGFKGDRADDAVNARCRSAAHNKPNSLRCHKSKPHHAVRPESPGRESR